MAEGETWEERFRKGVNRLGADYRTHFAEDYALRNYYTDGQRVTVLNGAPIGNLGTVSPVRGGGFIGVIVEGRVDDRVGIYSRAYLSKMRETGNYFLDFGVRRPWGREARVVVGQPCRLVNFNVPDKRVVVEGLRNLPPEHVFRRDRLAAYDRPVFDGIEWLASQERYVDKGRSEGMGFWEIFRMHVKSVNAELGSLGQPERRSVFLFRPR